MGTALTSPLFEGSERRNGESYLDYMVRLFEHKKEYGLVCDDIAALLNAQTGNNYTECTYRKYYAAFNDGRLYERKDVARRPARTILCQIGRASCRERV